MCLLAFKAGGGALGRVTYIRLTVFYCIHIHTICVMCMHARTIIVNVSSCSRFRHEYAVAVEESAHDEYRWVNLDVCLRH